MKNLYSIIITFAFSLLLIMFSSCDEISTDNMDDLSIDEIAQLIDKEVGEAEAENLSICKVLPIGAKPCGGPWGYLVYSEKESNTEKLKLLVERYNELDEIRMKEEGYVSTCDYATEPKLSLENGSCRGEGYAWNPGYIIKRENLSN